MTTNSVSKKRQALSFYQSKCISLAGKLIQATQMLEPNARVGVAVSGGMDSWVLLKVLLLRQRVIPFPYTLVPIHINPGFIPENHAPLAAWLEERGIQGHIENTDHGPLAHTTENLKKSACFYCARLRRNRLFEVCREKNLTHLAFGHNADDLAGTFLLNAFQAGRVGGMAMKEAFFSGSLTVIRPLMFVEKSYIAKAVKQWNLPVWSNPCPSAGSTTRQTVMDDLESICVNHKGRKKTFFNALCRWQLEQTLAKQKPLLQEIYEKNSSTS